MVTMSWPGAAGATPLAARSSVVTTSVFAQFPMTPEVCAESLVQGPDDALCASVTTWAQQWPGDHRGCAAGRCLSRKSGDW